MLYWDIPEYPDFPRVSMNLMFTPIIVAVFVLAIRIITQIMWSPRQQPEPKGPRG